MKKVTSKKETKKVEKSFVSTVSHSKEIVLAVICVLVIFFVAIMASAPKKEAVSPTTVAPGEVRNGNQVARISILPAGVTRTEQNGNVVLPVQPLMNDGSNSMDVSSCPDENMQHGSVPAGKRVVFKIDNFKKLAAQPLKFNVYDEQGHELTPDYLQTAHDFKLHFVLVSADLRSYMHLHPEYKNGVWSVSADMDQPGTYYAYVDISPVKGDAIVLRSTLTVREATSSPKYPGLTPNLLAIAGNGVHAVLTPSHSLGESQTPMTFTLTRDGKPVNNVHPYLGAFGHVVVFKHGSPDTFLHLHPMGVIDETKGIFSFMPSSSGPGIYTAFAQFKIDKDVTTFPITFELK